MPVTRAQFIARAPGKKLTGIDSTLVQTMLDAADEELAGSDAAKDERVHWLTAYRLTHYTDVGEAFRKACLDEYNRLTVAEFGGPRIF